MSSLLQFGGNVSREGVGLQFYRTTTGKCYDPPKDLYTCEQCGKQHEIIGIAYRKPVDMRGCWARFRYLGEVHAPDLSLPISVSAWPKNTCILSKKQSSKIWHS